MKFMHIADVHLGVVPDKGKSWSDTRAREVQETFLRTLKAAQEEQVDLLLIAGDLFHFPPTVSMLRELDTQLQELKNVTTIIIAGNHDYIVPGSPMERYEFQSDTVILRAGAAEQLVFDDLKTCVTGISYERQKIKEPLYDDLTPQLAWQISEEGEKASADGFTEGFDKESDKKYPEKLREYVQILLAHGGDAEHSLIDREKLRKSGFDYIALGHIHKPEVIIPDYMIYAGSLEPIDYTDTGERGYVIGEVMGKEVRTKWIPFSCRQYIDLKIDVDESWTNYQLQRVVQEQIEESGSEHIYRIILKGMRSAGLLPDLTSLQHIYQITEILDDTHEAFDYEQLRKENADNLLGRFIEQMYTSDNTELEQRALEYGVKALMKCRER